ncbi:MAG: amidase [Proteobacteria bacterium]|nr:amidase [Pseudomonadota bacterium]
MATRTLSSAADLTAASAGTLAAAIRAKEVSSVEVVNAYLARIEQVNPRLNAVVQLTAEAARREAAAADAALAGRAPRGPLHGVPFTVKDTLETAGVICTGGTTGRAAFVPAADATVVARLRRAGAILLGKTNTPEIAAAFESDNLVYGRTNNPYDLTRTPGGSTGGESAIVAAGGSPLGIGTDAGGSIRVPAHFCGLAGIKPTSGRIPRTGQFPPPLGARAAIAHVSLIARAVDDLALALPLAAGPDFRDFSIVAMPVGAPAEVALRSLKLAFFTDDGVTTPTAETQAAVRNAARALAARGVAVEESRPPGAETTFTIYHDVFRADGGTGARAMLAGLGTTELSPMLQRSLATLGGPAMGSAAEVVAAFTRWDLYRNTMLRFMEGYDALVSPIAPWPALLHGGSFEPAALRGFAYTMMHNLTGYPSVAVRVGTSPEGLPIGIQIAARPWREDVALALARQLESDFGGWRPPAL